MPVQYVSLAPCREFFNISMFKIPLIAWGAFEKKNFQLNRDDLSQAFYKYI